MINYDPLWKTMKKRHVSQYDLYTHYGIKRSLLHRLRKNMNVEIYTLDRFCSILDCNIEDIVQYVPDDKAGKKLKDAAEDDDKASPDKNK